MEKHTKGPWEARNTNGRVTLQSWRIGERNTTPGIVRPVAIVDNTRDGDEQVSNAFLIAAAPELLGAMQECLTDDNCTAIVTSDVAYLIRRLRAINKIARAAIAKARGEAVTA